MSVHDGHRSRLRDRLLNEGLGSFEPHEVLELLLYYTIPMRNVNPLAHELIEKFGSLQAVFNAPKEELTKCPGVGASTANWLHSIGPVLDLYGALTLSDRPVLDRLSRAAKYGERLFQDALHEQLWVMNMNPAGHLLHSAKLSEGHSMLQSLDMRMLVDTTLRYHAQTVVVMQRRLPARMRPTDEDLRFTSQLSGLLASIGVHLMDNVMICGKKRTSLREVGFIELDAKPIGQFEEHVFHLAERWLD